MRLNVEAILQLISEKFRNNKAFFADTIGVDRAYLSSVLNKNAINYSPKICNGIIKYCQENNLDYKNYIFLP